MANGDIIYQPILFYQLISYIMIGISHVSYNISLHFTHPVHVFYTENVDIKVVAVSALNILNYLNNFSVDNSTSQAFISEGALDDRADKCSINIIYHQYGRRRFAALQDTIIHKPCKCNYIILIYVCII